jgi:hypothetical protein
MQPVMRLHPWRWRDCSRRALHKLKPSTSHEWYSTTNSAMAISANIYVNADTCQRALQKRDLDGYDVSIGDCIGTGCLRISSMLQVDNGIRA